MSDCNVSITGSSQTCDLLFPHDTYGVDKSLSMKNRLIHLRLGSPLVDDSDDDDDDDEQLRL